MVKSGLFAPASTVMQLGYAATSVRDARNMTRIQPSAMCTAFQNRTIGSKVLMEPDILIETARQIEKLGRPQEQTLIAIKRKDVLARAISCHVGRRTVKREDYVMRVFRGRLRMFLNREFASETDQAIVVLEPAATYVEQQIARGNREEAQRIKESRCEYVITHVIAVPITSLRDAEIALMDEPELIAQQVATGQTPLDDALRVKLLCALTFWEQFELVADQ